MANYTDAEFEYVAGPMRVGDEHPTRRGWYWTGEQDSRGVWLWYKPPGPVSRWVRRIALVLYLGMMALGVGSALILGV